MDNFDEILKTLNYRKNPKRTNYQFKNHAWVMTTTTTRACVTPLGRFESLTKAAEAHGIRPSDVSYKIQRKEDWYYEEGINDDRGTEEENISNDDRQNSNSGA